METGVGTRPPGPTVAPIPVPSTVSTGPAADPQTVVAGLVSRHGPVTATALADLLSVTPAAVRRHLDALTADGLVSSRAVTGTGPRGRGRPARAFVLTGAGQDRFGGDRHAAGREDLALSALHFLDRTAGREAVAAFARERAAVLRTRVAPAVQAAGPRLADRTTALARALDVEGYAASTRPAATGTQVCQGQCPVHRAAADFPELCEAELAAFAEVLGAPVQRLSTMAGGAHVCTTHVTDRVQLRSGPRPAPAVRPRAGSPHAGGGTFPVPPGVPPSTHLPLTTAPVPRAAPHPTSLPLTSQSTAPARTDSTQARPGERTTR